jgi:hypothetical protein
MPCYAQALPLPKLILVFSKVMDESRRHNRSVNQGLKSDKKSFLETQSTEQTLPGVEVRKDSIKEGPSKPASKDATFQICRGGRGYSWSRKQCK